MPKRAIESFAFTDKNNVLVVVNGDDLYADDHPHVLAWPKMFRDALEGVIGADGRRGVEQATAGPGEKRGGPRK